MNIKTLSSSLVRDEGLRLKTYRCTAGKLTIGVGRNLDDCGITHAITSALRYITLPPTLRNFGPVPRFRQLESVPIDPPR